MSVPAYKRMVLINESEYFSAIKKPPVDSSSTEKQELPVDQTQKLYSHNLAEEIRERKAAAEEKEREQTAPPPLPTSIVRLSISKFPIYARTRGQAILEQLMSDQITWDEKGQIRLKDGEVIPNSSIIDIIFYAAADKSRMKLPPPVGFNRLNIKLSNTRKRVVQAKKVPSSSPPRKKKKQQYTIIGDDYTSL